MALFRSVATVAGFTLISRATGLARDLLIGHYLGAGFVADCFIVAQRFPNLFRSLFAEGAFSAAFVPRFAATLERDGKEQARRFADSAFSILGLTVGLFTIATMIAMPFVMMIFTPGFIGIPGKLELASNLSRITFPYLFFISLGSLLAGILNAQGRFAAAAGTPILLNLVMVAFLLFLMPFFKTGGHALSWAVSAAGVAQLAWLAVSTAKTGMMPRLTRPRLTPEIKELSTRILPVAFGAGLYQISLFVSTMLASLTGEGGISYLYYADRITQLPLGVVGIAAGTALLPTVSRQLAAGDREGALNSQNRSVEFAMLLTLPAMGGLLVLAGLIADALALLGAFSMGDALATARALTAFAVGLPAYVLIKVFTPGYYAREDTATPVRIAAAALGANLVFNVILMQFLGYVGIALGTALSSFLNAGILIAVLVRRGHYSWDGRLRRCLPRIVLASAAMTAGIGGMQAWGVGLTTLGFAAPAWVELGVQAVAGIVLYGAACLAFGAARWSDVARLWRRASSRDV